ncbi:hypothetical protein Dimus_038016 [Dionaea muscipula]
MNSILLKIMGMRIDDARCSLTENDFEHVKIVFPEAPGLIHKETGYFCFKPRPGYCPIYVPESPDSWKQRFVLVSSSDRDKFQPYMIPNYLNPTPSHLLSENDKWMLTVCDAGIGTVPHLHEVVTLENLEDYHIATVLHPRRIWAELRALYGENSYLNGHPTLYEISSTREKDEEEEEEADDEYSDGGDRDDTN